MAIKVSGNLHLTEVRKFLHSLGQGRLPNLCGSLLWKQEDCTEDTWLQEMERLSHSHCTGWFLCVSLTQVGVITEKGVSVGEGAACDPSVGHFLNK